MKFTGILMLFAAIVLSKGNDEFLAFRFQSYNFGDHYMGFNQDGLPQIVTTSELFRVVSPGILGVVGTISFESVRFPGRYLRHRNYFLHLDTFAEGNYELFTLDATFWPRKGEFFPGFTAYESYNFEGYFIRHQNNLLKISTESPYSELFQEDASFKPLPGRKASGQQYYFIDNRLINSLPIWECQDIRPEASELTSQNFPTYTIGFTENLLPAIVEISDSRFRIVSPGLTGTPGTVSLESEKFPGHYLRHKDYLLHLNPFEENQIYFQDATYWQRENKFFDNFDAFESFNMQNHYIRHQGYRLKVHDYDGTLLFRKDSSFQRGSGGITFEREGPFRFYSKNFASHTMGVNNQGLPHIIQIPNDREEFRFNLVSPGLTGVEGTISLASEKYPGHYLRHKNYLIHLDPYEETNVYYQDATFYPRFDQFYEDYVAFESTNYPNYYIRHQGYRLKISEDDGTELLHLDASFLPK